MSRRLPVWAPVIFAAMLAARSGATGEAALRGAPVRPAGNRRPRIFLTPEELTALRARIRAFPEVRRHYDAAKGQMSGRDRNDALCAAALVHLVDGDAKALARAKQLLSDFARRGTGGNKYDECYSFAAACVAYDWVFPALSTEERGRFGRAVLKWVDVWDARYRQPDWANQMYQMRGARLLAGIALKGAGVDDARAGKCISENAKLLKEHFIPAQNQMAAVGGGMIDGTGYFLRTAFSYGYLLDAWRSYSGEDLYERDLCIRQLSNWLVRAAQPHNDVLINWHDNSFQRNLYGSSAPGIVQLAVARCGDPLAKAICRRARFTGWKAVIWDDPGVAPAGLSRLPLSCHHTGIGMVTMRSDWTPGATFAVFVSGDFVGYHDWPSANIFYISKSGSLAVDASIYDNSRGRYGQKIPPDSHNTVLIGSGPNTKGQATHHAELRKGSSFDICDVLAYEAGRNYVYCVGDATRAYGGEARRFLRHFLFIMPDTFVVFDSVVPKDAATPVRWMIHGVRRPSVDEAGRTMTFTDGKGRLTVRTLLPKEVAYSANVGSYRGNGHSGYGVAIDPRAKAAAYEFLHVLHCGDAPVTAELDGARAVKISIGGRGYRVEFDPSAPRLVQSGCEGLVGQMVKRTKRPAGPATSLRRPASEAPAGPSEAEVKAAVEAEAKLRKAVIEGVGEGRKERVYVDGVGGRAMRARLVAADARGVTVRASGMDFPLTWEKLSPRRFYGVARKYSQDHRALAAYCRGRGLAEEAEAEEGSR